MNRPDFKALVSELQDDDLTVKRQKFILELIGKEVNEIWRFICKVSGRKLEWWAFSNDVDDGEGNGTDGGSFDPSTDLETIDIIGKNTWNKNKYYEYNDGFPTSFLWEDYKTIVNNHLEEIEVKAKDEKANKKQGRAEKLQAIKAKLTPEEWKFLKIKE